MINCFNGKSIKVLEVSVYHNMILIGSSSQDIYLIDYEYWKLAG